MAKESEYKAIIRANLVWLHTLIEIHDIDPEVTKMNVSIGNGEKTTINLAQVISASEEILGETMVVVDAGEKLNG